MQRSQFPARANFLAAMAMVTILVSAQEAKDSAPGTFFEEQVQPLLQANCYRCHGPEKQKSGLRLDSREAVLEGGSEGPAAVPGDPAQSLLYQALCYQGDLEMPPDAPLPAEQVQVFEAWIRLGLPWTAGTADASQVLAMEPVENTPKTVAAEGPAVRFNRDIRPILSENCYTCHGPQESSRKAGIRFDNQEGLYGQTQGGQTLVAPGDAGASEIYRRITDPDPLERMPPPKAHTTLKQNEIETIGRWIAQGAAYEQHWAFVPPEQPALPAVSNAAWCRTPIDYFILARLDAEGLAPEGEAERRTLIRRLSYDLRGLPPSLEEVHAFVGDTHDDAYARLVDRLLDSPQFGERMAVAWMDQSRYADTNGYQIDGGRDMWLWRDWVINAYNENMPFDEFLTEQLAGDLLPDAADDAIVATGFCRNHMLSHEGGTIPEENLTNYCVDRVKTTSEAFLGLTMACAQCHDHKFDPIRQKDYYSFFAFFNTLDDKGLDGDSGRNAQPTLLARTPLAHPDIDAVEYQIAALRAQLHAPQPALQAVWEAAQRDALARRGESFALHPLETLAAKTPELDPTRIKILDDGSVLVTRDVRQSYAVSSKIAEGVEGPITGIRIEFYPHAEVGGGALGYGKDGSFGLNAVAVSSGPLPSNELDQSAMVPLSRATSRFESPEYPASNVLDPRVGNAWSPKCRLAEPQHLTVTFVTPIDPEKTPYLTTQLVCINRDTGLSSVGHFRVFAFSGTDDGTELPGDIQRTLTMPVDTRTPEEARSLARYHAEHDPALAPLREALAALDQRLAEMTRPFSTLVMNTAKEPRKTHVLERGNYDQPREEVQPDTPAFLPPMPPGAPRNRLGLAEWLTEPGHPLTSRVAVNRLWQMLFGTGIVASSADFGSQGEWPSHPELLDWLAVDFVAHGWDVKGMMKQMVMSAAYRQSSRVDPGKVRIDPKNRLLSRGPRFRLQAEFIRDGALKVSGLLVPWIGGSSVKPYQPSGLWREVSHYGSTPATSQVFTRGAGPELYRRSLYTYWKRTVPPPSMQIFDAPSREICTMQRESTNTPLQALVLLNDPQFVEASRVFAARVLHELPDADTAARMRLAFEMVTSREPTEEELTLLCAAFEGQWRSYEKDRAGAKAYLRTGDALGDAALNPAEHAAMAAVANMILNLSETVTRS